MRTIGQLWRRRLKNRFRLWREVISLVVDPWVAIYLVVPALVFALMTYLNWLKRLPGWFIPLFLPLLSLVIAVFALAGSPRTYLTRADLVYIFPRPALFHNLLIRGKVLASLLSCMVPGVILVAAYPFYRHLLGVNPGQWVIICLWVLGLRIAALQVKWSLRAILNSNWFYYPLSGLMMGLFLVGWRTGINPLLFNWSITHAWPAVLFLIAWITAGWVVVRMFPIRRWEAVIADEEARDFNLMRMFLGHAAQAGMPATRSGRAVITRGRLGIRFASHRTLTYFYLKYWLRQRKVWNLYLQLYTLGAFIAVQKLPFWFQLGLQGFLLLGLAMIGEMFWQEHSQDLFLRMLPLSWNDCRRGVQVVMLGQLFVPILLYLVLAGIRYPARGLVGTGVALLAIFALILSGFYAMKIASLFNYPPAESSEA